MPERGHLWQRTCFLSAFLAWRSASEMGWAASRREWKC